MKIFAPTSDICCATVLMLLGTSLRRRHETIPEAEILLGFQSAQASTRKHHKAHPMGTNTLENQRQYMFL